MNSMDRFHRLMAEYQTEQISDEGFSEMENILRESSTARELFHRATRMDSRLRQEAENSSVNENSEEKVLAISSGRGFRDRPFLRGLGMAAAVVLFSALTWTIAAQTRVIATLVSAEGAEWERFVPTEPGSPLTRGSLRLSSGIAKVRLNSGVELTLEAPARIFLKGTKKASLVFGTAVVDARKAEDEFYLETEYGQAVGRGGEYLVVSDKKSDRAEFETFSGMVTVSHDRTREAIPLNHGQTASLTKEKLESTDGPAMEEPFEQTESGVRIRTNGRSATFIRNNKAHKWTRPEILTLKKSNEGHGFDQYSIVEFDLSAVESSRIEDAVLRMNLVPSGIGLASRLPKMNKFAVYGLVNPKKQDWLPSDLWEQAPSPADGKLVAQFEIPRSQQTGTISISGRDFLPFVKEKAGDSVTFILVRETENLEGEGHGLVHALASDSHPEAAGPVLEIALRE